MGLFVRGCQCLTGTLISFSLSLSPYPQYRCIVSTAAGVAAACGFTDTCSDPVENPSGSRGSTRGTLVFFVLYYCILQISCILHFTLSVLFCIFEKSYKYFSMFIVYRLRIVLKWRNKLVTELWCAEYRAVEIWLVVTVCLCVFQAPVTASAAGARSWAQASVTHGAQGDGESQTLLDAMHACVCVCVHTCYAHIWMYISEYTTVQCYLFSLTHQWPMSCVLCRWKGIKPTVAILSRGISHPASGWRPGQSWQRTGHCRSVVWARTKPPPPEWVTTPQHTHTYSLRHTQSL